MWVNTYCNFSVVLKEPVAGPSGYQQLRQLLKEALQILQDEGEVYRKVKSQDELYHVRTNQIFTYIFLKIFFIHMWV